MQIVGIQIDNSKVKWVFLSKNGGKISIERLDTIPIDRPGVDAKTTIASKCAKKNFESVTGISSEDLLIRKVKMKLKNTRAFQKTLPFQLETRLPFPLAEMIILPFDGKEESCFFALSKEKLQEHLEKYRMYGIDPERVSSEVNALTRFGKLIAPEKSTYLIVHVSHKSTTFVLMQSGEIGSSVSVPMGALQESHDQYKKQVDRAVFFLLQGLSVSDVLLTGLIDEASFIKEMMESEGRALIECESYLGIDFKKLQQYAVPIGLGLDAFSEDVKSAQFRKGRQMHPRQKKKLKRKIFSGALLCLLFSGIFVLFAEKKMFYQESLLEKEITHFALEKGFEDRSLFEQKDLRGKLAYLKKKMQKNVDSANFYKTPPKVSDLLVFLGSHPKLENGISIKRISYNLEKYPKLKSPKELYQVRVALDFEAKSGAIAKEFYEALLEEEEVIDQKSGIKWNREQKGYHVTFYTK